MSFERSFKMFCLMAQLAALIAIAPLQTVLAADAQKVREAAVAGSFYPSDPKALSAMIDDMLAHATPPPIADPSSPWLRRTPVINTPGRWRRTHTRLSRGASFRAWW